MDGVQARNVTGGDSRRGQENSKRDREQHGRFHHGFMHKIVCVQEALRRMQTEEV
jgi:hypothetical protein